tara:strand:+ start:360 stop:650 length:291 start_codon:yes stop_codon:yes gene_type:complete
MIKKNDGFDKWRDPKIKLRTRNEQLGMKFSKRRAALKKAKEPHIALMRKFKKASTLAKAGMIGVAVLPKIALIAAGYAGSKATSKENKKPKKYMAG